MFNQLTRITSTILMLGVLFGCDNHPTEEFQGYVEGDLTFIAPRFGGHLELLNVQEGAQVKLGQTLAQIELEPQQSQMEQAEFELLSAQKTLDNLSKGQRATIVIGIEAEIAQALTELKLSQVRKQRIQSLFEKGLVEKDALDAAITESKTKEDSIKQLKAKLEEAKLGSREDVIGAQQARVNAQKARVREIAWAIESKHLTAPDDGTIFDIFFRQGEFVPAAKPIMAMLMPQHQYVVFFMPVEHAAKVQINTPIMVDCEGCTKRYPATIAYISPKVEFTPPIIFSRQHQDKYVYKLKARFSAEDSKHFHLGQPVFVKIGAGTDQDE